MKNVIKAKTIGDKMYHLNRVHSKLVYFNSKYNNISQEGILLSQKNALENLILYLNCLFPISITNTHIDYVNSINQVISAITQENQKDLFIYSCYMQSCFNKFQLEAIKNPGNFCQSNFDSFCLPLFTLELERKIIKFKIKNNI